MRINWKKFGREVLAARGNRKLSVRDVADMYGMSPATVSRADRGLAVSAEIFLTLASYFLDKDPRAFLK